MMSCCDGTSTSMGVVLALSFTSERYAASLYMVALRSRPLRALGSTSPRSTRSHRHRACCIPDRLLSGAWRDLPPTAGTAVSAHYVSHARSTAETRGGAASQSCNELHAGQIGINSSACVPSTRC